jgi:hypothetical protein
MYFRHIALFYDRIRLRGFFIVLQDCSFARTHILTLMDYLKLLSLVIPAFGAFARKYTQNGRKRDAQRHAGECFQEIAGIGRVLYSLGREWRLDLDTSILDDLFKALVKRIVKPKGSRSKFRALARLKVCHLCEYLTISVANEHG